MKLKALYIIPCIAALMTVATAAHADTFDFTATGTGFSSNGTITATANTTQANTFDVTAISGTINGSAITALLPCAAYDFNHPCTNSTGAFIYDNLLGTIAPVLDYNGIGFTFGAASQGNFYFDSGYKFLDGAGNVTSLSSFTVSSSPVPEPSSFVLLGSGLLAAAGAVRRRLSA